LEVPLALRTASRSEPLAIALDANDLLPVPLETAIIPNPGLTSLSLDLLELFGLIDPTAPPESAVLPDRWEVIGLERLTPIGVSAQPINIRVSPIAVSATPINSR
jgi:hypothetical protein